MARPKGHLISRRAWEDALRKEGISLTEAARRANQQRATVSAVTTRNARASVTMAHALASAVDMHPETLFPTLDLTYAEASAA